MASSSKKKTTFAKINRENAVRERRLRKQARKDARKQAAAAPAEQPDTTPSGDDVQDSPASITSAT
jgi:lysozyme family protein